MARLGEEAMSDLGYVILAVVTLFNCAFLGTALEAWSSAKKLNKACIEALNQSTEMGQSQSKLCNSLFTLVQRANQK